MPELLLLTDGSVNAQSKVGFGAYLAVTEVGLALAELKTRVKVKRFEQTSSTKLELQTLLWALGDIEELDRQLMIYTDSQNIIGLPGRRERLEKNHYCSSKNRLLDNYQLYQQFYRLTDLLDCTLIKLPGHQRAAQKSEVDQLFTLVDRASRKALKEASQNDVKLCS